MSKKPPLSPEDQTYFQQAMRDVTPLKQRKPKIEVAPRPPPIAPHSFQSAPQTRKPTMPQARVIWDLSDHYAHPLNGESILCYHQSGMSKTQMHSLRTGQLAYQAKLDLHGLNTTEAKTRFTSFLLAQIQTQHRWLLIIHGKGGRFGELPILKNLVNHWLRQIPNVLAFHSAHPKHGGTGAVYVLLKSRLGLGPTY